MCGCDGGADAEKWLEHGVGGSVGSVAAAPSPARCWGPAKTWWLCVTGGYTCAGVWLARLLLNMTLERWVTLSHVSKSQGLRTELWENHKDTDTLSGLDGLSLKIHAVLVFV